ncbi:MAG: hypothetical protein GPOALKHO_000033 [Sodalis sp.]|nr:MAG: hypothetical protein GPOALKHO_000033 [Sodalis sp.]
MYNIVENCSAYDNYTSVFQLQNCRGSISAKSAIRMPLSKIITIIAASVVCYVVSLFVNQLARQFVESLSCSHIEVRISGVMKNNNINTDICRFGVFQLGDKCIVIACDYPFFYWSCYFSAISARSTSSMYAIGALSPARKPHFRIRV